MGGIGGWAAAAAAPQQRTVGGQGTGRRMGEGELNSPSSVLLPRSLLTRTCSAPGAAFSSRSGGSKERWAPPLRRRSGPPRHCTTRPRGCADLAVDTCAASMAGFGGSATRQGNSVGRLRACKGASLLVGTVAVSAAVPSASGRWSARFTAPCCRAARLHGRPAFRCVPSAGQRIRHPPVGCWIASRHPASPGEHPRASQRLSSRVQSVQRRQPPSRPSPPPATAPALRQQPTRTMAAAAGAPPADSRLRALYSVMQSIEVRAACIGCCVGWQASPRVPAAASQLHSRGRGKPPQCCCHHRHSAA